MVESQVDKLNILFVVSEKVPILNLISRLKTPLTDSFHIVTSPDAYTTIPLDQKYQYDILIVLAC